MHEIIKKTADLIAKELNSCFTRLSEVNVNLIKENERIKKLLALCEDEPPDTAIPHWTDKIDAGIGTIEYTCDKSMWLNDLMESIGDKIKEGHSVPEITKVIAAM